MNTARIGYSLRQGAESFVISAGLHYLLKRNVKTMLICGGVAAGLTLIESAIHRLDEADNEILLIYKPVLTTIALVALKLSGQYPMTNRELIKSLGYSFGASLLFVLPEPLQSNRYIIWLR